MFIPEVDEFGKPLSTPGWGVSFTILHAGFNSECRGTACPFVCKWDLNLPLRQPIIYQENISGFILCNQIKLVILTRSLVTTS